MSVGGTGSAVLTRRGDVDVQVRNYPKTLAIATARPGSDTVSLLETAAAEFGMEAIPVDCSEGPGKVPLDRRFPSHAVPRADVVLFDVAHFGQKNDPLLALYLAFAQQKRSGMGVITCVNATTWQNASSRLYVDERLNQACIRSFPASRPAYDRHAASITHARRTVTPEPDRDTPRTASNGVDSAAGDQVAVKTARDGVYVAAGADAEALFTKLRDQNPYFQLDAVGSALPDGSARVAREVMVVGGVATGARKLTFPIPNVRNGPTLIKPHGLEGERIFLADEDPELGDLAVRVLGVTGCNYGTVTILDAGEVVGGGSSRLGAVRMNFAADLGTFPGRLGIHSAHEIMRFAINWRG